VLISYKLINILCVYKFEELLFSVLYSVTRHNSPFLCIRDSDVVKAKLCFMFICLRLKVNVQLNQGIQEKHTMEGKQSREAGSVR